MRNLRAIVLNGFYFAAGLLFLSLAKGKSLLHGYRDPKPFSTSEIGRCIDYDLKVVDRWLQQLERYSGARGSVVGKDVLEIGPGADLGVGLYLLALGARSYTALDKHDLVAAAPAQLYERLFERIAALRPKVDIEQLRTALSAAREPRAQPRPLRYLVRADFDIAAAVPERSIDIVFSNAAFEHIEDVEQAMRQLSRVVRPGALLIAEVDLRTHSRWIRDQDPNNIYRYSDWLYRLFHFSGIPNRIRPRQYRAYLASNGWASIDIASDWVLAPELAARNAYLAARFTAADNQMEYLTILLWATKTAG